MSVGDGEGHEADTEAGGERRAPALPLALVREHPGLVLSVAYLVATGIGMLSSWTLYDRFGLNIFHFAQLSDFLLAAIRHPLSTAAVLLAVPVVWLIVRSDAWLWRHLPWYERWYGPRFFRTLSRSKPAYVLYVALYAYAFSAVYAAWMADRVRAGEVSPVEAQLQGGTYLGADATEPFAAHLIGSTGSFVFLYDLPTDRVTAVPLENLAFVSPR